MGMLKRRHYLQNVGWAHVDLGDDDKDGNAECQGEAQMLFGHAHDAGVSSDHQHAEV
jgi:hypothetical protein